MFILRPSSPLGAAKPKRAAKARAVEAARPEEPYVDRGLPVPESYDMDIIRAMLQDPFRIFIYWEVREESLAALTRYFSPEDVKTFRVVLRLVEVEGRNLAYFEVARKGRYWMVVFPDREYEFDIGVRSPVHGYISLITSNRVRTPRGTISPEQPSEQGYKLSPPEFIEVLEASGFAAEQSMNITVSALPQADLSDDTLESTLLRLPDALRSAITLAATGGALTPEMVAGMDEPLKSELMKLLADSDGRIASAGLMHYLPEILREVIEENRELIGDHLHPLHIAPRFFLGGSENITGPGNELRWPRPVVSGQWSVAGGKQLITAPPTRERVSRATDR